MMLGRRGLLTASLVDMAVGDATGVVILRDNAKREI
jgi:hypothetical protein